MSDMDLITEISQTFQSADTIWNGKPVKSPFLPNSNWIGFVATVEQSHLLERILGTQVRIIHPNAHSYPAARDLVRDLLPPDGKALFDTGFDRAPIQVFPAQIGWTPSTLACNFVMEHHDTGDTKLTVISVPCGTPL
jgi:hypothetical protein